MVVGDVKTGSPDLTAIGAKARPDQKAELHDELGEIRVVRGNLAPDAAAPFVGFSVANPFGAKGYVKEVVVDVATPATGAALMDVGVAATPVASDDTLIDGADVGTAAIVANNIGNAGTNGAGIVAIENGQFVNGVGSADLAGIVGTFLVVFVRA